MQAEILNSLIEELKKYPMAAPGRLVDKKFLSVIEEKLGIHIEIPIGGFALADNYESDISIWVYSQERKIILWVRIGPERVSIEPRV